MADNWLIPKTTKSLIEFENNIITKLAFNFVAEKIHLDVIARS